MIFVFKHKENIINKSAIIFGLKLDWAISNAHDTKNKFANVNPKGETITAPSICL